MINNGTRWRGRQDANTLSQSKPAVVQNQKRKKWQSRQGGVLPIVVVSLMLFVIILTATATLFYQRRLQQQFIREHYLAQTYLSYAEYRLHTDSALTQLHFDKGRVTIDDQTTHWQLSVVLDGGHQEQLLVPKTPTDTEKDRP